MHPYARSLMARGTFTMMMTSDEPIGAAALRPPASARSKGGPDQDGRVRRRDHVGSGRPYRVQPGRTGLLRGQGACPGDRAVAASDRQPHRQYRWTQLLVTRIGAHTFAESA